MMIKAKCRKVLFKDFMPATWSEKLGVSLNWRTVIGEAVRNDDVERLRNAGSFKHGLVREMAFELAGGMVRDLIKQDKGEMLEAIFSFVTFNSKFNSDMSEILMTDGLEFTDSTIPVIVKSIDPTVYALIFRMLVKNCSVKGLKAFINEKYIDPMTLNQAFTDMVQAGDVEKMAVLKEKGSRIDTCLSVSGAPIITAVIFGQAAAVEKLLEWGIDPNGSSNAGRSFFQTAVDYGDRVIVEHFLNAGAVDKDGNAMAEAKKNNPQLISLLENAAQGILPKDGKDLWQKLHEKRVSAEIGGGGSKGFI